jgi:hypothetical protein
MATRWTDGLWNRVTVPPVDASGNRAEQHDREAAVAGIGAKRTRFVARSRPNGFSSSDELFRILPTRRTGYRE